MPGVRSSVTVTVDVSPGVHEAGFVCAAASRHLSVVPSNVRLKSDAKTVQSPPPEMSTWNEYVPGEPPFLHTMSCPATSTSRCEPSRADLSGGVRVVRSVQD